MTERSAASASVRVRRRLVVLFDDDARRNRVTQYFNAALALLIVVNVSAVILESVEPMRARYPAAFAAIEQFATTIFAVEYALRVWTAVDLHNGRFRQPLWGRLRYVRSFFALIDLVSILPAVLGLLGAGDLRVLRVLRFLRMLKLTRHSTIFGLIWAVLREEGRSIGALVFILCLTVAISGTLTFMIEGDEQPAIFSSIPASMWWAIETLTTVGYGDMVPATPAGRVLGGVVAIVGIATLALFSGLITVGFLDQLRIRREQANGASRFQASAPTPAPTPAPAICPHCGLSLDRPQRAAAEAPAPLAARNL
jgi:voltage-gated potassium channel